MIRLISIRTMEFLIALSALHLDALSAVDATDVTQAVSAQGWRRIIIRGGGSGRFNRRFMISLNGCGLHCLHCFVRLRLLSLYGVRLSLMCLVIFSLSMRLLVALPTLHLLALPAVALADVTRTHSAERNSKGSGDGSGGRGGDSRRGDSGGGGRWEWSRIDWSDFIMLILIVIICVCDLRSLVIRLVGVEFLIALAALYLGALRAVDGADVTQAMSAQSGCRFGGGDGGSVRWFNRCRCGFTISFDAPCLLLLLALIWLSLMVRLVSSLRVYLFLALLTLYLFAFCAVDGADVTQAV